jgi:hypothetical protein
MEAVHEEKKNGLTIKIFRDDNPESPDVWGDNNLFLVGYHRDFSVDAPKVKTSQIDTKTGKNISTPLFSEFELKTYFECLEDKEDAGEVGELFKKYHIFPLSAYIHSGVRLYMGTHKVCQWDSCQVGAVLVAKEEWRTRKQAEKVAQGLIENWNDYLSGNVYGYRIEDAEENDLESCWGFFGNYDDKNGVLAEARGVVDHLTNKGTTDHNGQLLFKFEEAI